MTERLRTLQRQAERSGSVADAARLLDHRILSGEACNQCPVREICATCSHTREQRPLCRCWNHGTFRKKSPKACGKCAGLSLKQRVELSAYLGDPASRLLLTNDQGEVGYTQLGGPGATQWIDHENNVITAVTFGAGVSRWGKLAAVRCALAAGRTVPPEGEFYGDVRGATRAHEALDAVQAWVDCPCAKHQAPLDETAQTPPPRQRWWTSVVRAVVSGGDFWETWPADAIQGAVQLRSSYVSLKHEGIVVGIAIRDALVPWLLEVRA